MTYPDLDRTIATVFMAFPKPQQEGVLKLRQMIFEEAAQHDVQVTENLKWGQPSYVAPKGTPLRIGAPKTGGFALYAHCQSSVISTFAAHHGKGFKIEGNRAVHFKSADDLDAPALRQLISHALLYKEKRG